MFVIGSIQVSFLHIITHKFFKSRFNCTYHEFFVFSLFFPCNLHFKSYCEPLSNVISKEFRTLLTWIVFSPSFINQCLKKYLSTLTFLFFISFVSYFLHTRTISQQNLLKSSEKDANFNFLRIHFWSAIFLTVILSLLCDREGE